MMRWGRVMPAALLAGLACNDPAPAPVERILAGAGRAMGASAPGGALQLHTEAQVRGPDGEFRTLIRSSGDGRLRMEQPHLGFVAGVGSAGRAWALGPDGTVQDFSGGLGILRGHDLHMLALQPRPGLSAARFLGNSTFAGADVFAIAFTLAEGDSLIAYYRVADTVPIGLMLPGPSPPVEVTWDGWEERSGLRIFTRAAFRQGDETFEYRYTRIDLEAQPDSLFEPPQGASAPA